MNDLIRREDAIEALLEKGQRSRRYKLGEIWELNFDEIREALATVPSTEPKHGKWIRMDNGLLACSECGTYDPSKNPNRYCRRCGARMDG